MIDDANFLLLLARVYFSASFLRLSLSLSLSKNSSILALYFRHDYGAHVSLFFSLSLSISSAFNSTFASRRIESLFLSLSLEESCIDRSYSRDQLFFLCMRAKRDRRRGGGGVHIHGLGRQRRRLFLYHREYARTSNEPVYPIVSRRA